MKLVYSPQYNIRFFKLERFHPFDSAKYGRAWKEIGRTIPHLRDKAWVRVPRPASLTELESIHDRDCLHRLHDPRVLAQALELPMARRLPRWIAWRIIVRPVLWGVAGSLIAAREALTAGLAVNRSDGGHHARSDHGERFFLFIDTDCLICGL